MVVRALSLVVAAAALAVAGAVEPVGAQVDAAAPVAGLLVTEYGADGQSRLSVVSLAGRRLPAPARLQTLGRGFLPWRLSPDARLVAAATREGDVVVGRVRGGAMRMLVRSPCAGPCSDDPTFAWSPAGRYLAVAAGGIGRNGEPRSSLLRIVDLSGRVVKSFAVPRSDDRGDPVAFRVLSWSPDGSRLLLRHDATYGPTAAVVRVVETGSARTVADFAGCDAATLTWSPDGRYLALDSRGTQDCLDWFELIDAVRGKTLVRRSWDKGEGEGGTVWAVDGKSVFGLSSTYRAGRASGRIDRIDLSGRRTRVIESRLGRPTPRVALGTGLVYDDTTAAGGSSRALNLHRFATGRREQLATSARGFSSVEPLQRLP